MSSAPSRLSRLSALIALSSAVFLAACSDAPKQRAGKAPIDQQDVVSRPVYPTLQGTIGQYAFFADAAPIPVNGWGVVANLAGTGSGDMSPEVRNYLSDQLYREGAGSYSKGTENINPERILASNQTAAVELHGLIPPLARPGDTFDLTVSALPDTQTTSLQDGLLWTSDLKIIGLRTDISTHAIAVGRGPIYIPDRVGQSAAATQPAAERKALRSGFVIGGGVVTEGRLIRLQLFNPSYLKAGAIQRAINSRFPGRDVCASADNDTIITLNIPRQYANTPAQFVDLVLHMYLAQEVPGFTENKAAELCKALQDPKAPRLDLSTALAGLGRSILPDYIEPLYTSPDPAVRFWAGRAGAMLNDVGGMVVLEQAILDRHNPLRKDAIQAMIDVSSNGDTVRATLALSHLLNSPVLEDRLLGYGGLVAIRSPAIRTYSVAKKFLIDVVPSDGPPLIYVTQSSTPRIALIGSHFDLPPGALYVSPDNLLTVNVMDQPTPQAVAPNPDPTVVNASALGSGSLSMTAPVAPGKKENDNVVLFWRPPLGGRPITIKTSTNLADLIARLGWVPDPMSPDYDPNASFIGASYQRVAQMLASMCKDQTLNAQFVLQPAPKPSYVADPVTMGRPEGSTAPAIASPAPGHSDGKEVDLNAGAHVSPGVTVQIRN